MPAEPVPAEPVPAERPEIQTFSTPEDEEFVRQVAAHCDQMKVTNLVVQDVRGLTSITDFFILATCGSSRQMGALAEELRVASKHAGNRPPSIEGLESSWWVLLDLNHVVVHLFTDDARRYYDLDSLWGDAPRFEWQSAEREGKAPAEPRGD